MSAREEGLVLKMRRGVKGSEVQLVQNFKKGKATKEGNASLRGLFQPIGKLSGSREGGKKNAWGV